MNEATTNNQKKPIPSWAERILWVSDNVIFGAPGKELLKVSWVINFQKILTFFVIYLMMHITDNFSVGAWVYLGLHGVYGYCWLIKDFAFRDPSGNAKISVLSAFNLYAGLVIWYWLIPWLFLSRHIEPSGFDIMFAIVLHTLGVVLMMIADGQRHWVCKYRKGLINFGVYRYTRNPNYLGEIMLYSAYAYLASHWVAWLIIAYMTVFFLARMMRKDHSISRHEGWKEYEKQSGLVIPWALFNGQAKRDLFNKPESADSSDLQGRQE